MDPKEIVHNVRQKQAKPLQANGTPLSDRPVDNSAPEYGFRSSRTTDFAHKE